MRRDAGWLAVAYVLSTALACVDLGRPAAVDGVDARVEAGQMPADAPLDKTPIDGQAGGTGGSPPDVGVGGASGGGGAGGGGAGGASGAGGAATGGAGAGGGGGAAAGGTTAAGGAGGATGGAPGSGGSTATDAPVRKGNGQACAAGSECTSGVCADQVCCNAACAGTCESCIEPGKLGTCSAVAAGSDPAGECAQDSVTTCRQDGSCNGARACRFYAAGTGCAAGTCSGGQETAARSCDGAGTCAAPSYRTCAPYACGAAACTTTCLSPADCVGGAACIGGSCLAASGLALYWNFDEASGTVALDFGGQGRNGTYEGNGMGAPTPSTMVPALQFTNPRSRALVNGGAMDARLKNLPAALMPANNVTLSAWFRSTAVLSSTGLAEIITIADGFSLVVESDAIGLTKRTGTDNYISAAYATTGHLDGNWHHVAGVSSSTAGMVIYLDGVARDTKASTAAANYSSTADLVVGGDINPTYNAFFGGNLDEIRIYTRPLSAAEVMALATGGR
jgi:hypothetical protein